MRDRIITKKQKNIIPGHKRRTMHFRVDHLQAIDTIAETSSKKKYKILSDALDRGLPKGGDSSE